MNPLNWKREHQLALAIAAGVGSIAGLMIAPGSRGKSLFGFFSLYASPNDQVVDWFEHALWPIVIVPAGWALLGAILGAAVVYTRQLLKA